MRGMAVLVLAILAGSVNISAGAAQTTPSSSPSAQPAAAAQAVNTAPLPDYAAIRAQSAALSKADRARAKQLFATAFTLWQSGNFPAAEIGFKQGLDIDPANAMANYYYADCLVRRKDKTEAKDYLQRAAVLGNGTAEGMEAQADLQKLSVTPTDAADMTPEELNAAFIGKWSMNVVCQWASGTYEVDIEKIDGGAIIGPKSIGLFAGFEKGSVNGDHIVLDYGNVGFDGRLITPSHVEGHGLGRDAPCQWTADKH